MTWQECLNIRMKTGLSQRAFAKIMSISIKSVLGYEKGRAVPERTPLMLYQLLQKHPKFIIVFWDLNKDKLTDSEKAAALELSRTTWIGVESKAPRYNAE